jgi:Beta-propeller repeat
LLFASASGQLSQTWVEKYGDPSYTFSIGTAVALLPNGNFVVAGYAETWADRDFLTICYDPQGNQVWARTYDGPLQDQDEVLGLAVDVAGNVIVAGLSKGTASSATDFALATAKYAADGTLLWTQRFERLGPDPSFLGQWGGLGVDSTGNVYVAGSMLANTPGATVDVVLVAYDPQGITRWVAIQDGPGGGTDLALDLAVTSTDEVRISGTSGGCATYAFAPDGTLSWAAHEPQGLGEHLAVNEAGTTFVLGKVPTSTGSDLQVLAYDSAGNHLWSYYLAAPQSYETLAEALRPGIANDLYVTGSISNAHFPLTQDILTARLGPAGEVLWLRQFGSPSALESPQDLAVDGAGNAYITGQRQAPSPTGYDSSCLTLKYSPAGVEVGNASFGEPTGPYQLPQAVAHALALADDASFLIVTGLSIDQCTTLRYDQTPPSILYCTSKPSSIPGCVPSLGGSTSLASLSAGAGMCDLVCAPVPGGSPPAIAIASTGGPLNPPVLQTFGWLCIESGPAFFRLPADQPGGTSGHCDGYYEFDVTAWLASHAGNPALVPGGTLDLQVWYRDPPNPGGANLSNALALELVP